MIRNFKVLIVIMMVFVLIGSSYAFAAANTIDQSNNGVGTTDITGYTTTAIVYNLDADKTKVVDITFDVNPVDAGVGQDAVTVYLNTVAVADWTQWTCSLNVAAPHWKCTTVADDLLLSIVKFDVVASSSTDPA